MLSEQPCAFIATDYMILGRLATYLDCQGLLLIRPQRIAKIFVISDITTVLVQVGHCAQFCA